MESRGNHLADIAAKLAALKQAQPFMETLMLPAKATEDLKITLWNIICLTKYKEIVRTSL